MDIVLLAGYLKLIPAELCRAFKRRMLNIHPGKQSCLGGLPFFCFFSCWLCGAAETSGRDGCFSYAGLLPSFGGKGLYGLRVHQAVLTSGARFSGPTIHFVDEEYDTGPILAQRVVPVSPLDTPEQLAARVLKEEHIVYPEAVAALCDGRVTWREDGVPIMWTAH